MRHRIELTPEALRDLDSLDRIVAQRIELKLQFYEAQTSPLLFAKRLRSPKPLWRFRIGDYRAVFEVTADGVITILLILRIKHRREAYT